MLASTPGACITWDACDPVFQRGCSAGKGRQLLFDGTTDGGASQCVPGGAAAVGDPCPSFELAGMSPCVPGSQCYARPLPDGAGALDVGLAGACPSAQTCVPPREWIAIHSPTPAGICI